MDHAGKRVYILMGSPRKNGNTIQLLTPFLEELTAHGCQCEVNWLYDKSLEPCLACRACQQDWSGFHCCRQDDMQEIFDHILACDLLLLATPIYCWYCTPPMKAVLDRLMYGMNKFYGEERGAALWAGKPVALFTTCGYEAEKGADLWESGMMRYCKHSQLRYLGSYTERDLGYQHVFMDEDKAARSRAFARQLLEMDQPEARA